MIHGISQGYNAFQNPEKKILAIDVCPEILWE